MHRFRPSLPGHSTLAAYLALFVALGGTSYAALKLPRGSVGTGQLRNGAVTSAKVKDHSLKRVDLAPGVLTRGPAGPDGVRGPTGATGSAGAPGAPGAPGALDTSQYYDKVASDARFLGLTATAADAAKLGNVSAGDYVRGPGSVRYSDIGINAGASASLVLPTTSSSPPVTLQATCSDPPSTGSVRVVVPAGRLGSVTLSPNNAASVQQQFFGPAASTQVALAGADHVSVFVASTPDLISADLYFNAGLGGANQCNLHGFITTEGR